MSRACKLLVLAAAAALCSCSATPVDPVLPAEHRALPYNLLEDAPAATDNSFVWRGSDGSYRFGMKGDDQWRVETRDEQGSVQGQYFYRTPNGGKVNMKFRAGPKSNRLRDSGDELLTLAGTVGGAGEILSPTLQRLHMEEGVLPYGALKLMGNRGGSQLRTSPADTEDEELQAIITEVRPVA